MSDYLTIGHLSKNYGTFTAVSDLSFTIKKGSIVGFLGPNGSGKTTTIKVLAGLLPKYTGTILYNGRTARHIGTCREVKFIFDSQNFYENLTAFENLSIVAKLNGIFERQNLLASLEALGLAGWENKPVRNFSRGMRQRLALSMAEYEKPELLILDEPTNGLDVEGILDVEDYFKRLNRESGCTIVISSHYLEQVERLAGQIVMIYHGKKVFDGDFHAFSAEKNGGVSYTFINPVSDETMSRILAAVTSSGDYRGTFDRFRTELTVEGKGIDGNFVGNLTAKIRETGNDPVYIKPLIRNLTDFFKEEISMQSESRK